MDSNTQKSRSTSSGRSSVQSIRVDRHRFPVVCSTWHRSVREIQNPVAGTHRLPWNEPSEIKTLQTRQVQKHRKLSPERIHSRSSVVIHGWGFSTGIRIGFENVHEGSRAPRSDDYYTIGTFNKGYHKLVRHLQATKLSIHIITQSNSWRMLALKHFNEFFSVSALPSFKLYISLTIIGFF